MIEIKKVAEQEQEHTQTSTDNTDMEIDINDITDSIIEEELKNFKINENNSNEEIEETEKTTSEISEETAKIKDLLESLILVFLFVLSMKHKNIENKQKVVMDFVKERKDAINRICVCMEKTIARNAELYKKIQKANDISFLIQLAILALEFEGILNEMEKKTGVEKQVKKEGSRREEHGAKQNQEKQTITNTTKLTETGTYAEVW